MFYFLFQTGRNDLQFSLQFMHLLTWSFSLPFMCVLNCSSKAICLNLPRHLNVNRARMCSVQLPREWRGAAARERRPSASAHRLPVAPAGGGHDCDGQLQPGRAQRARLLVRRPDPEEEGDAHPAWGLWQNPARVGWSFSL